ncbi:MAG: 2-oxo acid dehydrogenase subunit E2 [Deltaproteobacteria bacterium]|nr:2-oxo acid dehydrogenase subunit E2 [Deltaproteobacteria bacterium]
MAEFRMPSLGADMEAGTVIQWLVKPGDAIKRGDIIAVVDTEKAAIEIEVFEAGVLERIVVPEGEKVPVGAVLAIIQRAGEGATVKPTAATPPPPAPVKPIVLPPSAPSPPPAPPRVEKAPPPVAARPPTGRLRVSPLAMRVAVELGVDLGTVQGTGPDGAITKADVEKAVAAKAAPPVAPVEPVAPVVTPPPVVPTEGAKVPPPAKSTLAPTDRHAAMRRAIAAAMTRSKREIPHYYLGTRIDMSRAVSWLQAENLKRPVTERLLYAVLLLKAVAVAVRQFPEMNGFWTEGAFKPSAAVHLGVAISLRQGGLIAPALHDVDQKSLSEIMVNLRDLVKRVRAGVLRSSEIADATITVTSLGEQGVESVFGIIYPPQVALVGFGKVVEQPWAANGMVGARPTIMATVAADHRASDGHRGGLFLATIERLLQEPEKL